MKLRKSQMAAAIGLIASVGIASQASASIYAGSRNAIDDLNIVSSNTGPGGGQDPGSDITSFQFDIENTADLNGASDLSPGTSNSCGGTIAGNDCGADPALDADAANAPGSDETRANSNYAFFGDTGNNYSNSNSVIDEAQLTGDDNTSLTQIAETLVQTNGDGGASAQVGSSTGFIFDLELDETTDLTVEFTANPELQVAIDEVNFDNGNTRAGLTTELTLTQDGTGDAVTWSPEGTGANDCSVDAGLGALGVSCTELADEEDLNRTLSLSSSPATGSYSPLDVFSAFGIEIAALPAGNWTLGLTSFSDTRLRVESVPVPGTLLMLGAGLLAAGVAKKKRIRASDS